MQTLSGRHLYSRSQSSLHHHMIRFNTTTPCVNEYLRPHLHGGVCIDLIFVQYQFDVQDEFSIRGPQNVGCGDAEVVEMCSQIKVRAVNC